MSDARQSEKNKNQKKDIRKNFLRFTHQMANTVLRGVKMASGSSIYNPLISNKDLYEYLLDLGPQALALKPETLFAEIDRKYGSMDSEKISEAMLHFHETGELKSAVPEINRQRIYAFRILMTSDTAYHEWNIFEKIGCVMNGRLAHFGEVEPLSAQECAITVAVMDSVRPDKFSAEVGSYIAAACHMGGVYTLKPCKWLSFAEDKLQIMNKAQTGRDVDPKILNAIESKMLVVEREGLEENFIGVQAVRLFGLNKAGEAASL